MGPDAILANNNAITIAVHIRRFPTPAAVIPLPAPRRQTMAGKTWKGVRDMGGETHGISMGDRRRPLSHRPSWLWYYPP